MKKRDRIAFHKMISYAEEIQSYVHGLHFEQFARDRKTINACAFLIGQIGELVNVIDAETQKKYAKIPWRNIKGMRNRIVHNYEKVDYTVLWGTITESMAQLAELIAEALDSPEI